MAILFFIVKIKYVELEFGGRQKQKELGRNARMH